MLKHFCQQASQQAVAVMQEVRHSVTRVKYFAQKNLVQIGLKQGILHLVNIFQCHFIIISSSM